MANIEKLKEQARKFELKEQWSKAIEPLVRAIEEFEKSPDDDAELALYNRVADLYMRVGDNTNAIQYYERAVELYTDVGLTNQAIALCNKVMRLSPGRASLYLKLGILFAKKGFAAEAKQNLLEYAGRMQKAGQIEEAFRALKKFAEMTSGQDEIWSVLAQQARAHANTPEAREQVDKLLAEFEQKEKSASQRKSRMSRSQITGEVLHEEPPHKKGELIFLDVGESPAPRRSGGRQAPAVEGPPAPPPPPRRRATAPPTRAPVDLPPLEIESTALAEEEAPEEIPTLDVEPTSLAEEGAAEAMPPLELEPTSLAEPEAPTGQEYGLIDLEGPEAEAAPIEEAEPAFEQELPPEEPPRERRSKRASAMSGLPMLDTGEEAPPAEAEAAAEAEPAAEPEAAEQPEYAEPQQEYAEPEYAAEAEAASPEQALEDLPLLEELPAETAAAESEAAQSLEFLDLGEVQAEAPDADSLEARVAANPEDWEGHRQFGEALMERGERERGLAEMDASLDGYDQADDLESAYGVVEEVLRLEPNSIRHQQKRVELAYRQGDRQRLVDAYLELADALLRSNEPDKSIAVYQRVLEHDPQNVRARSAVETLAPPALEEPEAAEPAPQAVSEAGYVDLGSYLLEEEGPKDLRMRIQDEEPTGDEQRDFQMMLAAFKRGIEANVGDEDFQSHYDLGVAYKEMGLLDEAIAEFQKALRSSEGRLKSSEALGLCFFEKGQHSVAETILRRGLDLPARTDAERVGLLYWLGRTLEEQGKGRDALEIYHRVFGVDINFHDVNQRVAALRQSGA
jgi:tetratricopeptide (TPR) repeat protein